jgi:hypothetical protein
MSVRQPRTDLSTNPHRAAASRLAAAQVAVHDLHAQSSIVAVQGNLQLDFRDHALAWLGSDAPLRSITLHEGDCFVTPQRGVVSISATHTNTAVFLVQSSRAGQGVYSFVHRAAHRLACLVRTRLRRAV